MRSTAGYLSKVEDCLQRLWGQQYSVLCLFPSQSHLDSLAGEEEKHGRNTKIRTCNIYDPLHRAIETMVKDDHYNNKGSFFEEEH